MANVLRKLLVPAALALTSFALPSAAMAAAPADVHPSVGTMCLNTDIGRSFIVNVTGCSSSSAGQHWTVNGQSISESVNPGMCLNTDIGRSFIVNVTGCSSSSAGQHWTVNGESISESTNPGMCLASDYPRSRIVSVEACNSSGTRQHWTVQGEQISMTLV